MNASAAHVSRRLKRLLLLLACLAWALSLSTEHAAAQADDDDPVIALTGVLKRVKESGIVRIGYREHAAPFSFAGKDGPYGYSIDICHAIAEDLAEAIGRRLRIEYTLVTTVDRIDRVADGRIDFECGATTSTAERRQRVAFSPLMFVAGTRLLVKRGSRLRSAQDLPGRTVVVARGTTNEEVMRRMAATPGKKFVVEAVDDYPEALRQVESGKADALAADDILMEGYLAENRLRAGYAVVGPLISFEPYGIVFARDDAPLARIVNATFERLARSREIRSIYGKWFLRALPSGYRLGLPMSDQLERSFQILGLPVE